LNDFHREKEEKEKKAKKAVAISLKKNCTKSLFPPFCKLVELPTDALLKPTQEKI
jgi:hypothetical protein